MGVLVLSVLLFGVHTRALILGKSNAMFPIVNVDVCMCNYTDMRMDMHLHMTIPLPLPTSLHLS